MKELGPISTSSTETVDSENNDIRKRWREQHCRLLQDFKLNPKLSNEYPVGTAIFVVPLDDIEVAEFSMAQAQDLMNKGEKVGFYAPQFMALVKFQA